MADSCRPVSRHGRYNATGPSSVQYTGDVSSYGNVDFTPSDEMYTVSQPERPERPRTSRGRRRRAEIPLRPESRRGDKGRQRPDTDEESSGRPISRVGFSPDSSYRYSHDEFSRQVSSDNEKQILNSPCTSPEILYQDENYFANQKAFSGQSPCTPPQVDWSSPRQPSEQPPDTDRLIISPSIPQDMLAKSPKKHRRSPQIHGQSPQGYRQSPQSYRRSPMGYRQSPHGLGTSPQQEIHHMRPSSKEHVRPSSREYLNVSPLLRDEDQIQSMDLHHSQGQQMSEDPAMHEGDSYQLRFSESPLHRNSPYRENPQVTPYRESPHYRESPSYARDSPYYNASPTHGNYGGYSASPDSRPPPAPRPKSSRPKTSRKKSARIRQQHRYQDQETSPPQQCDTSSILNSGDPYGRPSSSLSPYKPLPAIGASTPRSLEKADREHKVQTSTSEVAPRKVENVTVETKRLMLEESTQFCPADDDSDIFRVEDIQGASGDNFGQFTGQGVPDVDMLTKFPQHLSEEIYKSSVSNYEKHVSADDAKDVYEKSDITKVSDGDNLNGNEPFVENELASVRPLDYLHDMPAEPQDGEERLLLAIKLPDGKRIQRHFSPQDILQSVMHFAENTNLVNYEHFQIMCNAPRSQFVDLSLTIGETQLRDRTVLYLEEKD